MSVPPCNVGGILHARLSYTFYTPKLIYCNNLGYGNQHVVLDSRQRPSMACYQNISFKPLSWSLAVENQSNITLTYVVIFLLAVNATLFGESYFKMDLCKLFMLGQFG